MLLGNLLIDSVDQRHVHGFNLALCPQKPLPLRGCWYFYRKMCLSSWQKTPSNDLWCYFGPQSDKYIFGQSIKKENLNAQTIFLFDIFRRSNAFELKGKTNVIAVSKVFQNTSDDILSQFQPFLQFRTRAIWSTWLFTSPRSWYLCSSGI